MQNRFDRKIRRAWEILYLAVKKFFLIDGVQWAGAFAFNAFFSLFPMIILLVTLASLIVSQDMAVKQVIAYIEKYVPLSGEMQRNIFDTIAGVIEARGQTGVVAAFILIWTALQCFTTLIYATNLAWGTAVSNWWRLPSKSLVLLGITASAVFLGIVSPVLMKMAESWFFPNYDFNSCVYGLGGVFILLFVMFSGLSLFYSVAPRQPARFAQVWFAALCATVLLQAAESLFLFYLKNFATFNAVYGAFGGMMALLLWIYLSGCIFIFGACLCAAQAEGSAVAPHHRSRAG